MFIPYHINTSWWHCYCLISTPNPSVSCLQNTESPGINFIKFCLFLMSFNPHMHKMGPWGSKHYILVTVSTQKMSESSDSMYSFILMLENIWHHHFTWSWRNSQEIVNFTIILGPGGPTIGTKFTIWSTSGKIYIFCIFHIRNMKKEEYMESELSSIFV